MLGRSSAIKPRPQLLTGDSPAQKLTGSDRWADQQVLGIDLSPPPMLAQAATHDLFI